MQRKIKVRVWSKALERFLTKDEWFLDFDGDLYFREYDKDSNQYKPVCVPEEYYIVQQFTGLFDKNGKEIFEGDIVKFAKARIETIEEKPKIFTSKLVELGEDVGEIVYMSFSFCVSFDHKRYDDIEQIGNYPHRFEIIGNILENPELLKQ